MLQFQLFGNFTYPDSESFFREPRSPDERGYIAKRC